MTIPRARRLDFSEIAVIGIAGTAVVEAIQRACSEVGYIYRVDLWRQSVPITSIP